MKFMYEPQTYEIRRFLSVDGIEEIVRDEMRFMMEHADTKAARTAAEHMFKYYSVEGIHWKED